MEFITVHRNIAMNRNLTLRSWCILYTSQHYRINKDTRHIAPLCLSGRTDIELIVTNRHISDWAGLIPVIRIIGKIDICHRHIIEHIILNDYRLSRSTENSSCRNTLHMISADYHICRIRYIFCDVQSFFFRIISLYLYFQIIQCLLAKCFLKGNHFCTHVQFFPIIFLSWSNGRFYHIRILLSGSIRQFQISSGIEKNFISRMELSKSSLLAMNIFQAQRTAVNDLFHSHITSMDINRIIMRH